MNTRSLVPLCLVSVSLATLAHAQTVEPHWWVPNGAVNAIERDSLTGTVYLGGDFTSVGAPVPFGAWLDPVTGIPDVSWAQPNGTVYNGIPDGTGGWFICGSFTQVGNLPRTRVARLNSAGSVTGFNVDIPSGIVRRILLSGDTLYMGGDFTAANNQRNLLAVNANTGAYLNLFPGGINGIVRALEKSGTTLWAGGNFTRTNGDGPKLSQMDKTSAVTDWHFVKPNGDVLCSAPDGAGGWYIGGTFTTVGGVARQRAARINADGTMHAWDPNVNADVNSIEVVGSTVYLGGTFTTVGGQTRGRLAAVDATTGAVLAFFSGQSISPGYNVNDLVVNGTDLIVGGRFSFAGTPEPNGAKLDISTGAADLNYVNPGSPVFASVPDGSGGWFIGGTFTQVNGTARVGVARINADGTLNTWNPVSNGNVLALHFDGSTLYMGGSFTTVGGQPRRLVAAVDGTTGALLPFNANNVSGTSVNAVHKAGSTLYVGGGFDDMGGTTRQYLAALDATTGAILPGWKHVTNAGVRAMTSNGNDLFTGGDFSLVGLDRPSGTAVDPVTGEPDFSYLEPNSSIYAAIPDGSGGWYIGGSFDKIGFTPRSRIARINADGTVHPWNPGANNHVRCLLLQGGVLYAGGDFTQLGGQTRNYIGAVDVATGTATTWNPNLNAAVLSLGTDGTNIVAGGSFTTLAGNYQPNFVSLNPATDLRAYDVATNNTVSAVKGDGTALYMGGSFTNVGRAIRYGAVLTTSSSIALPDVVMPNNEVHCSMPDGAGGWYIGGGFTAVNGVTRNYAARINADGTLHAWNPNANSVVYSMAMGAGAVYLGGSFTNVGGNTRNRIAAVDATTGVATAWNPNANDQVLALVVDGSSVYAGGRFSTIGGQTRQKLAQLDATTGLASTWNANMAAGTSAFVQGLELSGTGTLYVAGEFGSLGGATRIRAGEISLATAVATAWAPAGIGGTTNCIRVNDATSVFIGQVGGPGITKWNRSTGAQITTWNALVSGSAVDVRVDAGVVYFGGQFTSAGGQTRHHAAALDASTAAPLAWSPMLNNFFLRTISIAGGNIFIGGGFTLVNVVQRNRLAELTPVTGAITAWDPNMAGNVLALELDATTVYAGGAFTTVNGSTGRNRIAALNRTTGLASSWSPNADSDVAALWKKDASTIYVGGYFNNIGGAVRSRLAEVDLTTGLATAWDPSPENGGFTHVKTVAYDGTRTYVGGQFQYMKAVTRSFAAAFNLGTHDRTAWNPNAGNSVHALTMNGSHVLAGGDFTSFGGAARNRAAEVDANTGVATAWDPNVNATVYAIQASGGAVYLGGGFTSVAATERYRLAAVDGSTGALLPWDPGADATVRTLSAQGSDLYVGGDFQLISGKPRSGLMAVDRTTSDITPWDPRVSSLNYIHQMFIDGGLLYVGGFFGSIKGVSRASLAAVDLVTGIPNAWNPGANSEVYTLTKQGSTVYCGGVFTTLAGQPRTNMGAVDATTGTIVSWNPAPNGVVRTLAVDGTTLYIGGAFTNLMSTARNRAASVDLSSFTLNTWDPNADGEVSDIAVVGGKALLTGVFNNIGGAARNSLASWNVSTGLINTFNPGANNDVHDLVVNGSTLYVAGEFTTLSANTRNRIGAVNGSTGAITTWNPNASTTVTDIELAGATMYACGPFTSIGGATRSRLAELNLASNTATAWNPGISGGAATPNRLTVTPTSVIVTGGFTTAGGQPRVNLAEIDRTTGLATGWNPDPNSTLQTVVYNGTHVFAGGSFTVIGNQPRARLAALDASGALTAWNPGAGSTVRALALDGNNVYVGGDFTTAGGQPRNRIAAIDRITGSATAWNPNGSNTVHALHLSSGAIYAGGTFLTIGGASRLRIAQLDLGSGLATSWAPTVSGTQVSTIQHSGNTVWLGGSFSDVNVTARSNIASVDATTGALNSFNPNANGAVNTMALDGNDLYIGGTFQTIGGQARNRFAKLDATTGVLSTSDALADNPVLGMAHTGTKLIVGGSFTNIGGSARTRTAVLDKSALTATGWDIGATNNNVNAVATDGVRAFFGGLFTSFAGTTRGYFGVATLCPTPSTYYRDNDGDGYGNPLASVQLCEQVPGVVADNTDCNDNDAAQYPAAPCDDLNACTSPDAYDAACACVGTPLPDGDGDGTCDVQDGCPMDPLKTAPGQCGCGNPDTDTDVDLTADCNDLCPTDPLKVAPGICGCGVEDTDTDGDLTADCNDLCPLDPLKVAPGICGCGVSDADSDGDLTVDCNDGCPNDPLKIAPGQCGCGVADTDTDNDGIADCIDGCPGLSGQVGSACDDGNACTEDDVITASCQCVGENVMSVSLEVPTAGYSGVNCGPEVDLYATASTFSNYMGSLTQAPYNYPIADGSLDGPGPGNGYATVLDTNGRSVDASTTFNVWANITSSRTEDLDIYLIGPGNCGAVELSTDNAGLNTPTMTFSNDPLSGYGPMEGSIQLAPIVSSGPGGASYSIPTQPLVGCPYSGDWRLFVADDSTGALAQQSYWNFSITDQRESPYSFAVTGPGIQTDFYSDTINGSTVQLKYGQVPYGEQEYQVTVTATNGCSASDTVSIVVAPRPTASWSGGGITVCEYTAPDIVLDLEGTAPFNFYLGGFYSSGPAPGYITTNDTELVIEDPNGYYTANWLTDSTGCAMIGLAPVSVELDTISYAYSAHDTAYACDGTAVLRIYSNLPGSWSGGLGTFSDINDPQASYTMHPSEQASGTTLIWTALVPDPGPCDPVSDTVPVIFKPGLSAIAGSDGAYCENEQVSWAFNSSGPLTVEYWAEQYYSGAYVTDSTYGIDPFPGEFYLTALSYANGQCPSTQLGDTIVVDTTYVAPFVYCGTILTVCGSAGPVELTGCSPTGGTYSGPGVLGAHFDPGSVPAGIHTLNYQYMDSNACVGEGAQLVDVLPYEPVTCPVDTTVCADATPFALTGSAPAGGTFFGPGVSGGLFDPGLAGIGSHPVAYVRTGTNGCADTCWTVYTVALTLDWYADLDGDGAGDAASSPVASCLNVPGHVLNNTDTCDTDPLKTAPGQCGCGELDTDTDNDLTADCNDGCPNDPNKTWEGICGCGNPDVDSDGDTVMDCLDGCPNDPNKLAPGLCGCGTPDGDTDGDGTADCNDLCPMDPNKTAPGSCGCGQAEPGTACNDGDPNTGNDVVNANCQCVGLPLDCAGTPGGPAVPGTACDDGDANTLNDAYDANCVCSGTPANAGVQLTLTTDGGAAQTSWEIIPQGGGAAICSGAGYANNSTLVLTCPIVAGCYELRVLDSFGDGMSTGGYVLRDANGQRIIDNAGDGVFTFESRIANSGGFCLPLGTDRLRSSRCDLETMLPADWVAAEENAAVSAQFGTGAQNDDGYQFWFFNPDGGYSRRILVTHASASYLFPAGPARACHIGFSGIITNPLPQQQLLNVRVRSMVNGVYAPFGPACRMRIGPLCATTQLNNDPMSTEYSCGVTRVFGATDKVHAQAVTGANRYRFRFERMGGGFTRVIASTTRSLQLKWLTLPLVAGDSYTVTVAPSYDGGATYCPYGAACTVAIVAPATAQARSAPIVPGDLLLFPNPNQDGRVNVLADGLPLEATTADLSITDLFGKQVYSGQVPVTDGVVREVIDLSGRAASGVYLVGLRSGEHERIQRLVIE